MAPVTGGGEGDGVEVGPYAGPVHAKPHFTFLGTPVRIEPLFWLGAFLIGYRLEDARLMLMWVLVVLVSLLVHEFGHALALKAFGQTSSIVLHGFGGLTFSQHRLSRPQSIVVSLAGPFLALGLLGLPMWWLRDSDLGQRLATDYFFSDSAFGWWPLIVFAFQVNVYWSLFNLAPIRPLDGGNVMTQLIGADRARMLSIAAGLGAAAYIWVDGAAQFSFVAILFALFAFLNFNELRQSRAGQVGPSVFDVDAPTPTGGGGHHPGAIGPASPPPTRASRTPPRRGGRPTGPPRRPAGHRQPMEPAVAPSAGLDPVTAEATAWRQLRAGDAAGAGRILARSTGPVGPFVVPTLAAVTGDVAPLVAAYREHPDGPASLAAAAVLDDAGAIDRLVDGLLATPDRAATDAIGSLQTHLHYGDRHVRAAEVGERLFAHDPVSPAQVAFDTAAAWTRAGQVERGVAWVGRAIDAGFSSAALLDGEPDLAAARAHPSWPAVRSRLG